MASHPSQPVPQPPRPHIAPALEDQSHRERFDGQEAAIVLSHYDLGVVEHLRVFPRGSRRSPKLRIKARKGEFLLKRRAIGQDDPHRVAFGHDLQIKLAQSGYPVPGLIGTRDDNNSMLQLNGRAYELFNFIHGVRTDGSAAEAVEAGKALGTFHRLLANHSSAYEPRVGSFHASGDMDAKAALLVASVCATEPQVDQSKLAATAEFLRRAYHEAGKRADEAGFRTWPRCFVHGDWHPGNMLFRDHKIVGVLDFDSSRMEPRVVDAANAALQFSMRLAAADDPTTWPEGLSQQIIRSLLRGYDQSSGQSLSQQERWSIPWLMIEALIVETVVPIAATGSFARLAGSTFLSMVERKIRWITPRAAALVGLEKEPTL